jgi:excisionase family DNA binding protein
MSHQQEGLPRLLTAAQVAADTGLSRATIWKLARTGRLPVVRIGRACRFSAAAVQDWAAAGGSPSAEAPSGTAA